MNKPKTDEEWNAWAAKKVMEWTKKTNTDYWIDKVGSYIYSRDPYSPAHWNPHSNLNHTREVELKLFARDKQSKITWVKELGKVCGLDTYMTDNEARYYIAIATAPQRMEAIWRTVKGER